MGQRKKNASRKKFHFVYKTTCKPTGKYYVGMHSTDDMEDGYLGSGLRLQRSVKKYGREDHVREILEDCSKQGRKFLREREKEIITLELIADPLCMNLVTGGSYVFRKYPRQLTHEHRKKISEAAKKRKGWHHTNEAKQKISESHKGKPSGMLGKKHSEKTKQKLSVIMTGKKFGPISEERRQKLSESHKKSYEEQGRGESPLKGRKLGRYSVERRKKISEALKGRKRGPISDEQKKKISESMKKTLRDKRVREKDGLEAV